MCVVAKVETGIRMPVEEQQELMFGMALNQPACGFVGEPADTVHFSWDKESDVDSNAHVMNALLSRR